MNEEGIDRSRPAAEMVPSPPRVHVCGKAPGDSGSCEGFRTELRLGPSPEEVSLGHQPPPFNSAATERRRVAKL